MDKIKKVYSKIIKLFDGAWILKCLIISLGLEILVEVLGRRSIFKGILFLINSPIVYLYNVSIIFFTLLFALFLRKRIFGLIMISAAWVICGIVNFVVLGFRVTPFAAVDFLMLKDTFSMIDVYYTKPQQIIILIAILLVIAALVFLFIKTPKFAGDRKIKGTMLICIASWILVWSFTNFAYKHNIISDNFSNLGMAYENYGFAYCFTNSIIDNGISEPEDYSEKMMEEIEAEINSITNTGRIKKPNIIVIQLESFIDPNEIDGLIMDKDPVPTFTALKKDYPSGYFKVPAVGAGTANTEFEVLTGISSSSFGAGEYPYKTTLNETPVEGMASLLEANGYGSYAIHNNKSSFYDRANVYEQMGFDAFISLEYMYNVELTSTGWAKDKTLVGDILACLDDTKHQDFVFTISVQGHGRYPDDESSYDKHVSAEYTNKEMEQPFNYYINQLYEMDLMIKDLIEELDARGEDYVLLLYGDHLPSLELVDEQLPSGTIFDTEYIIVNNIGLKIDDQDIYANDISTIIFEALNMPLGYAQKAHLYYEDTEIRNEKITCIAYDMLFGDRYLYDGNDVLPEQTIKMGVRPISITKVEDAGDKTIIYGDNFNGFSMAYLDGKTLETKYIDINTLEILDYRLNKGDKISVAQVDKTSHILSTTDAFVY